MTIPFSKYSGSGNDFILIDNRDKVIRHFPESFIPRLCHRHSGIGADGVILLEKSEIHDYRMRIFNSDGSEAEMCGNGVRCLAKFLTDLGAKNKKFDIETMCTSVTAEIVEEYIKVKMPTPHSFDCHRALDIDGSKLTVHSVDTGVPHAVLFVDNLSDRNLMQIAPIIRFHKDFYPKGTNVNFVSIDSDNSLHIRTFERGVEKETLACGTGAVACAIISSKIKKFSSPIRVQFRSRQIVEIIFEKRDHEIAEVYLIGPAVKIFQGEFEPQRFGLNTTPAFV